MTYFLVLFLFAGHTEVVEFTSYNHCVNAYEFFKEVDTVKHIVGCLPK